MIDIAQPALDALALSSFAVRLRVKWKIWHGTDALDVTDRVIGSIAGFVRSVGVYLAGSTVTPTSIMLSNSDGFLTPGVVPTHLQSPFGYHNSEMTIEEGIVGTDGGTYYYTIYTGRVHQLIYQAGRVEVMLRDALSLLLQAPLPVAYTIPFNQGGSGKDTLVSDIIEDVLAQSSLSSVVFDDADTVSANVDQGLRDAGWLLAGRTEHGVVVADVLNGLASSCVCHLLGSEAGAIRLLPEWPEFVLHSYHLFRDRPAMIFDKSNSAWPAAPFSQMVDSIATEIVVEYQGTTVSHRDTTNETFVGYQSRRVAMPYCARGHQAMEAARILITLSSQIADLITFSNRGYARLVQLGDWIKAKDPITETVQTYRVVAKAWSREAVAISAVRENQSLVESSYAIWGTTTWGTSVLL